MVRNHETSWSGAREHCRNLSESADLVIIDSRSKQNFIRCKRAVLINKLLWYNRNKILIIYKILPRQC